MRLLLSILFSLFLAACGGGPKLAALPAGSSVLAFGDSVTYGTGAAPGEDYPRQLAALTGWTVHNGGVPGETADAAKARIRAAIEETRPALVIVEIGGNDFLRRRPASAVKEDIRAILKVVRESGANAVLVAVPELALMSAVSGRLGDADVYAELAKEERVPLVESVFSGILSDPALRSDAVHPNANGYRKLAEGIATSMKHAGLLAK